MLVVEATVPGNVAARNPGRLRVDLHRRADRGQDRGRRGDHQRFVSHGVGRKLGDDRSGIGVDRAESAGPIGERIAVACLGRIAGVRCQGIDQRDLADLAAAGDSQRGEVARQRYTQIDPTEPVTLPPTLPDTVVTVDTAPELVVIAPAETIAVAAMSFRSPYPLRIDVEGVDARLARHRGAGRGHRHVHDVALGVTARDRAGDLVPAGVQVRHCEREGTVVGAVVVRGGRGQRVGVGRGTRRRARGRELFVIAVGWLIHVKCP